MKINFLLGLSIAFACATSLAKEPGITDTEIIVGGHTSVSGKFGIYAASPRLAAAYFDQVNENGGVHGRKIKYIQIDTQGENVKTVQAAKKLVEEDGIFAFFFAMGLSHKSISKYIVEKNIPDFFFTDAANDYGKP